jgi:hypothetical protein
MEMVSFILYFKILAEFLYQVYVRYCVRVPAGNRLSWGLLDFPQSPCHFLDDILEETFLHVLSDAWILIHATIAHSQSQLISVSKWYPTAS